MTALRWAEGGRYTIPERFAVQHERPLHEPPVWSLICHDADDAAMLPRTDIESAFYGRGGASKVRRAAQQLADIVDPLRAKYRGDGWDPARQEIVGTWQPDDEPVTPLAQNGKGC